jgi:hypothetical protein
VKPALQMMTQSGQSRRRVTSHTPPALRSTGFVLTPEYCLFCSEGLHPSEQGSLAWSPVGSAAKTVLKVLIILLALYAYARASCIQGRVCTVP